MELKKLVKGDEISNVQYGTSGLYNAVVLGNYPEKQKIALKIKIAFFGLFYIKTVKDYNSYSLEVAE